jgi:hypothetical protein
MRVFRDRSYGWLKYEGSERMALKKIESSVVASIAW